MAYYGLYTSVRPYAMGTIPYALIKCTLICVYGRTWQNGMYLAWYFFVSKIWFRLFSVHDHCYVAPPRQPILFKIQFYFLILHVVTGFNLKYILFNHQTTGMPQHSGENFRAEKASVKLPKRESFEGEMCIAILYQSRKRRYDISKCHAHFMSTFTRIIAYSHLFKTGHCKLLKIVSRHPLEGLHLIKN